MAWHGPAGAVTVVEGRGALAATATIEADSGAPPQLTGMRLYIATIACSLGSFLALLDVSVANVSVPHIAGALGASPTQGTWIITSYAVAEAIGMPLTGWLAKRYGALRTYLVALGGFMVASALCGAVPSLAMLVVARVLQGACGAPLLPLCQTLTMRIFPGGRTPTALAVTAMVSVMAPVLGPILGGTITDNISWRWIFYLNIPFVPIAILLCHRLIGPYETKTAPARIDYFGLILVVVAVGAFQLTLDLGREYDWFNSTMIVTLAIVAAIGFAAFLIWELTEEHPVVDLRVMRHRGFWAACLCMAVGYASLMSTTVMVPLWVQTTLGYPATDAGWVVAPSSMFSMIMVPLCGMLVTRLDPRFLACCGLLWVALVATLRAHSTPDLEMWQIAAPQALQGISNSMIMMTLSIVAINAVDLDEIPSATGLLAFVRTIGTAIGISLATTGWDSAGRVARAELVGELNGAEEAIARMTTGGMSELQSRSMLEAMIGAQSRTVAFDHVFALMAALAAFTALLIWIIPRPGKRRI